MTTEKVNLGLDDYNDEDFEGMVSRKRNLKLCHK